MVVVVVGVVVGEENDFRNPDRMLVQLQFPRVKCESDPRTVFM